MKYTSPEPFFKWKYFTENMYLFITDIFVDSYSVKLVNVMLHPTESISFCALSHIKELSHDIETGRWYGCVLDLYLERCRWAFIIFLVAPAIFNSN
jgi:hypothetical protein